MDTDEDVVQVNVHLAGVVWETHHDMTVTSSDQLEALNSIISSFKFTV